MSRFDGNNMPDEFFSNEDSFGEEVGRSPQDDIGHALMLDNKHLNQKILFKTITMLENSEPKWQSKTLNAKLKIILRTYSYFLGIIEES